MGVQDDVAAVCIVQLMKKYANDIQLLGVRRMLMPRDYTL